MLFKSKISVQNMLGIDYIYQKEKLNKSLKFPITEKYSHDNLLYRSIFVYPTVVLPERGIHTFCFVI